jgi:O-antigen biosynthesis alpha-1,2-mannosyltransferase
MRIVIDLQGSQNTSRQRGIGRYSLALSKAIARNRGNHEIFIALNGLFPETIDEMKDSFSGLMPDHHFIVFNATGPVDELNPENYWRVRTSEFVREKCIRDLSPDLLLVSSLFEGGIDNTVTSIGQLFSQLPTAVILYDLIPYIHPEKYIHCEAAKKWYYRKIEHLKRADLLLAISNSSRCEAIDHLGIDPQRVVSIFSAANQLFSKANLSAAELSALRTRYGINRKFLMHMSAFDVRKNFEGLIKAFGTLRERLRKKYQLVLVCNIDDDARESFNNLAAAVGLEKDALVLTGYVPDDDLVALYSECHLFVFPSFQEGFGLPPLEAMCCGAAAIGSNTSSIPEVIGREDALFDPASTTSMANLIERALTDRVFWQALKEHAKTQSKKFSWDQCARIAIEAFEKLSTRSSNYRAAHGDPHDLTDLIENIACIKVEAQPSEQDLLDTAISIDKNENAVCRLRSFADFDDRLRWRIEGPFDSNCSLALLNRETARALEELGHFVILHSTEGPGDFPPDPSFLESNPDLARMNARAADYPQSAVDVTSHNLFPPRVEDMTSPFNLLHNYDWEESGFPQDWVNCCNAHLNGLTCLSNHMEKILIDNGVCVPMVTSGCGVDHWERIHPAEDYHVKAKRFRFLHVSSCLPHKGVDLLFDAYGKTFTISDDVTLIIKTLENPHNEIHRWLAERKAQNSRFPHVLIIEGDPSDSELKSLYQQCQVFVAPSRAEGFGLPMAEAMLSGLPVITTAWGGQLDFCNADNAWLVDYQFERAKSHFGLFTSTWAKIEATGLAEALRQAYHSPKKYLEAKALAGRKLLLEKFKWVDVVGRVVEALHTWRTPHDKHPPMRIGWITTWNTKCGIATYSEHLISNMPQQNVVIFAPHHEQLIKPDSYNCIRCWNSGKYDDIMHVVDDNNLYIIAEHISKKSLNIVVIQFNYGFFNFGELNNFIEQQLDNDRIIIVMMHSTSDPVAGRKNWQLGELQPVLSRCHRILVHSVVDLNRLKAMGLTENVALFPHGVLNYPPRGPITKRDELPLIASYGFCLPHKGLVELVQAVRILKQRGQPVRLRLVNAEYPNVESAQLMKQLKELLIKLEIDDLVEMHTEFLEDQESLALLSDADLLLFPYQETGESSSAAARYGLAARRPVAVTPLGIFEDLGNAAFRFSGTTSEHIAQGITEFLHDLSTHSERAQHIQLEAQRWREAHDYATVGKRLYNICSALMLKHGRKPRTHRFLGSSPLIRTEVGNIQGRNLTSTKTAGCLMFGPYLTLAAGDYQVRIGGALGENSAATARMDVTIDKGKRILAKAVLRQPDENGWLVSLPISLEGPCTDLDVRVRVDGHSEVTISMLEITSALEGAENQLPAKCVESSLSAELPGPPSRQLLTEAPPLTTVPPGEMVSRKKAKHKNKAKR